MKRKKPHHSQPTFYREDRLALPVCYVRAEVMLTQQDWLDLEVIAEEKNRSPRELLAEAADSWLRQEIAATFEEAA